MFKEIMLKEYSQLIKFIPQNEEQVYPSQYALLPNISLLQPGLLGLSVSGLPDNYYLPGLSLTLELFKLISGPVAYVFYSQVFRVAQFSLEGTSHCPLSLRVERGDPIILLNHHLGWVGEITSFC